MRERVTIIGAGPGGLAAAILLAGAGLRVTVLERLPRIGGRTSTLEVDGFRFDVGPTFFLYPQILQEIFAAAGYDLQREAPMTRLDPQYRLVFGSGGELLATPRIAELDRRIAALSPGTVVLSMISWTTIETSSNASAPASSRRSSAGAIC
jgi:phytoene desaturase